MSGIRIDIKILRCERLGCNAKTISNNEHDSTFNKPLTEDYRCGGCDAIICDRHDNGGLNAPSGQHEASDHTALEER